MLCTCWVQSPAPPAPGTAATPLSPYGHQQQHTCTISSTYKKARPGRLKTMKPLLTADGHGEACINKHQLLQLPTAGTHGTHPAGRHGSMTPAAGDPRPSPGDRNQLQRFAAAGDGCCCCLPSASPPGLLLASAVPPAPAAAASRSRASFICSTTSKPKPRKLCVHRGRLTPAVVASRRHKHA